ncbi:hypothetical protein [Ponticaulis profundi]|uniref:Uncharacterized protein n=1 Tax=Ponticaulis profundi TaxID=2665222 RepID=A0ABW1S8I0_9PROT
MTQAPASANAYASLSLAQLIGLNLARLYAWLVRFEASGQSHIPTDIASMVFATDAMVHAFIRLLASEQLERAGFVLAARAMRDISNYSLGPKGGTERSSWGHEQSEGAADPRSRGASASTQKKRAKGPPERSSRRHEKAALSALYADETFARANKNAEGAADPRSRGASASTGSDLLARLETTIETFERAETLASDLARIILCAWCYLCPETRRAKAFRPGKTNRPVPAFLGADLHLMDPWPPPDPPGPGLAHFCGR